MSADNTILEYLLWPKLHIREIYLSFNKQHGLGTVNLKTKIDLKTKVTSSCFLVVVIVQRYYFQYYKVNILELDKWPVWCNGLHAHLECNRLV